jgi:hypothetical protein
LKTRFETEEGISGHFEEKEKDVSTNESVDRRRFGIIETKYRQLGKLAMYNLTINGKLWACVEWSASRRAWCVQDASGRCLAHCDAIHGQDIDAQTAVKLAKAMIRDGRMPTPEEAQAQLEERLRQDRLGEPLGKSMELLQPKEQVK